MRYAVIDENNVVTKVLENDESFTAFMPKSAIIIDGISPTPKRGWYWTGNSFIPGEYAFSEKPYLHLSSDRECIKANGTDEAIITAELKDFEGNILDINTIDYAVIPNYGALKVVFIHGKATISFKVGEGKSGKIVFEDKDSTKYNVVKPLTIYAVLE